MTMPEVTEVRPPGRAGDAGRLHRAAGGGPSPAQPVLTHHSPRSRCRARRGGPRVARGSASRAGLLRIRVHPLGRLQGTHLLRGVLRLGLRPGQQPRDERQLHRRIHHRRSHAGHVSGVRDWLPARLVGQQSGDLRRRGERREHVPRRRNDQVSAQISGTRAFLYGETGNDTLTGGPSSDWLHGGSGDDVLNGNDGHDNLSPEGGDDKLVGGPGPDYAWFDDYYQPVTVTLNGQADDGATGEHADVQTENVIAGPEADTLTGNAGANTLHGMNGDDVIEGRGGADYLIGHYGDDTIWALDRARDYISCGDGYDQVLADSRDDVSDDCESVSAL